MGVFGADAVLMGGRHREEAGYVSRSVFEEKLKVGLAIFAGSASLLFTLNRPPPRQIQSALQNQSVYLFSSLWRSHLRGTARWRDGCVHVAMPSGGRCPRPRRPGRFGHRQPRQATRPAPRACGRQKRRPLSCFWPTFRSDFLGYRPQTKQRGRARRSERPSVDARAPQRRPAVAARLTHALPQPSS